MTLRDAAGWAIEHGVDAEDPFATGPAGGVGKYVGSDGTPWIDEHVAKEYGCLRGTSTFEATELIIDALDLRHRFPRVWRAVKQLQIRVRDARRISKQCRDLSQSAAATVDAELFRKAALGLPWPRLSKILAAAIMNADPALHKAKLKAAKFDRRVWLSESEHGLRTLVIRADEGNQVLLYALIERIAEILELEGDTDPIDQRRSKATGWLARPEDLTVLLYKHSQNPKTQPNPTTPPADPRHPPGSDRDESSTEEPCDSDAAPGGDVTPGTVTEPAESDAPAKAPAKASSDGAEVGNSEPQTPTPPADWPDYDWDAPEPAWNPGASDRLPTPRNRWFGTHDLPGPEPCPPAWCYLPPPDDPGPPGTTLSCDVPRLVDYLTAKGLKPARPRVIMNVHLTDQTLQAGDGVIRVDDAGPMLLSQLLELLGHHHCQIRLRPVLDPANLAAVDAYEVPQALRDAVRMRHPASVFPFSSRHGSKLDLDHTVAHTHTDKPTGQTRVGNLGPLARPEHRAKTDGVWHVEQPHPDIFLWRSPHGHYFLVTNQGTQALGPMPVPRSTTPRPTVVRLGHSHRRSAARKQ